MPYRSRRRTLRGWCQWGAREKTLLYITQLCLLLLSPHHQRELSRARAVYNTEREGGSFSPLPQPNPHMTLIYIPNQAEYTAVPRKKKPAAVRERKKKSSSCSPSHFFFVNGCFSSSHWVRLGWSSNVFQESFSGSLWSVAGYRFLVRWKKKN